MAELCKDLQGRRPVQTFPRSRIQPMRNGIQGEKRCQKLFLDFFSLIDWPIEFKRNSSFSKASEEIES